MWWKCGFSLRGKDIGRGKTLNLFKISSLVISFIVTGKYKQHIQRKWTPNLWKCSLTYAILRESLCREKRKHITAMIMFLCIA